MSGEIERNKSMFQLAVSLLNKGMAQELKWLENIISTDTPGIRKSYEIVVSGQLEFLNNLLKLAKDEQ